MQKKERKGASKMNFLAVIVIIIGIFGLAYSIMNYQYWTSFNEPVNVNNPTVEYNTAPLQMPAPSEEELKESPFDKCMKKYGDNWTIEQHNGCRASTAGTNE